MEVGTSVWLKDLVGQESWVAANVVGRTETDGKISMTVRACDSDQERVFVIENEGDELAEVKLQNSLLESEAENLINLPYLHEPAILHCLQLRYTKSEIYTYTGPILIAMNPFKRVNLYTTQILEQYYNRGLLVSQGIDNAAAGPLPPHVYAIADAAYRNMMTVINNSRGGKTQAGADQAILISGESGAGKTESTKIVLRYLTTVGNAKGGTNVDVGSVMDKVLQSNPILEAFGNSKTIRNDNSSRFGKFIELNFNRRGHLIGGRIETYLLEKVRLPSQQLGERGFHIFYQICAGSTAEEKAQWRLLPIEEYRYANQGQVFELKHVNDVEDFEDMRRALNTLNFPVDDQKSLLDSIAAVLHLGQLEFEADNSGSEEGSTVKASDGITAALKATVGLLQVSEENLVKALTTRTVVARSDSYVKMLTAKQASDARDAMAKAIYGKLFDWLVATINLSIAVDNPKDLRALIGVLDIFGFECFKHNSFEQLCINYTNETLQQQFNRFVFKFEQDEYTREQISWSFISFPDNQDCLDLIEDKQYGLLSQLDDECKGVGGSDQKYADKLYRNLCTHEKYKNRFTASKAQVAQKKFCINHYAGPVIYATNTFVEKNKDELPKETAALFEQSGLKLLSTLFTPVVPVVSPNTTPTRGSNATATVGTQFKLQLLSLMQKIETVKPHYIRCLKPNDQNVPDSLHRMRVTEQLRYGGVLEAVRVARSGFPVRLIHADFYARYRPLANPFNPITAHLPRTIEGRINKTADSNVDHTLSKVSSDSKARANIHSLSDSSVSDLGSCTDPKILCDNLLIALWDESVPEVASGATAKVQRRASRINEMALWRGKGETAKESIQLGLTKVFLRKQAHDLLEARRSRRLVSAARKIQSHYRRYIIQKMYDNIRRAIRHLQCIMRMLHARRQAHHLRCNKAILIIQKYYRRYQCFVKFQDFMWAVVRLQNSFRALQTRKSFIVMRSLFYSIRMQRLMRGLFQRKRYQRSKSRIIRLQCLYRVHRACKILKTLKSEAKDLGKLKQSNEQMKAEIELWRKKALEDSERVAAEMKAKAAEEQKIAMAEMTSELMNEKEVSSSLRTLLKEAEDKIELLEAKVSQLEVSLSAAESNAGSGAVAPPQPPVMSSPSSSQHKKSSSAGGVAVSISSGNDGAAHAKLQAEYDTLLSMHERESAIWSVKLAEMEELNAQMYQLSEANAKIDEENSELNDEIARLRSLLLDQGSLGPSNAVSNANSATVTPTEKNLRRASMGSIGSGGRTAAANISKMIVSAANATGDKLGRNISSGASGLNKSTKTSDTKFMTPIVTESANTATTPNSVASQLFRAASPSTLEQLEKNFGADSEDDDDEEEYPSRRGSTASMSGGSASRRGSSAGNRERRPSTESEASAIGLFQKNVESYKTKLKQGFHVGFWDGKKILPNGEYVRLNKFDGTLRMQVDGQLSITKQQASFKSLLGIGGASKSEICPIVIGDIVEVMCINSEMMKVYHLDKAEESLLLYVVSMCTNPSVYDPNHKQSNSHGLPSFERMTIIRTPSPTERQVLYNTLRTIMVNGIAQDEHTLSVTGGFRNTEKKQRRLSTRESVLLAKADSVRAAAEIAIAAAEANSAKNTPSKGIGDGNEAAATGSAASPPKHHRRGSTLPLSASGDHEASSVAATAAAKRRASIREAENAKVQELQNQLMTEQANHHKLVVQVMTMSNELNEKDQVIIASKKREEALSAILASKEKVFEQDASARVQLGQKMQALFIEKMDALEQADHYKDLYEALKAEMEDRKE